MSRRPLSAGRAAAVAVLALVLPVMLAPPASAAVTVTRAEVRSGELRLEGRAVANRTITVDGTAMGTSGSTGTFRIARTGYRPPGDCTVDVNDGSATPAVARLTGCTVTSTPPPATTVTITPNVAGFVANVGTPFLETFVLGPTVTSPSTFRIEAGTLPAGLALTPIPITSPRPFPQNAIRIQGTPTTEQTTTVTLRGTDANGLTATRTYTFRVDPPRPLTIAPQAWGPLVIGSPQNLFLDGDGGVKPYRWSIAAGALPPGMAVVQDSPDVGLVRIGGTPTATGTYSWTLRLTDARGAVLDRAFTVVVEPAPTPTLLEIAVTPTVTGGTAPIAGVRILPGAPPGGSVITLSSTNPLVASVPASVTVPAGETNGFFPVTTAAVTATTSVVLSATFEGRTLTTPLTVTPATTPPPPPPPSSTDTVTVSRAEYDSGTRLVRVEASSSPAGGTLRVHVTSTGALLGTLSGGRGEFAATSNPQSITVRSSLGGSASRQVAVR